MLFPTRVYQARLPAGAAARLNEALLAECRQVARDDLAGRRWSARNYPGGYTSYNSLCRMPEISPTFARLAEYLNAHVRNFARELQLDLRGRKLAMTDCWVNVMRRGTVHSLHLHPLSTISGTYYVSVPPRSSGLKFEDPRLASFMAAPPRRSSARQSNRHWVTLPAQAGALVLFESWLRHEVPSNLPRSPRVSISFNYHW